MYKIENKKILVCENIFSDEFCNEYIDAIHKKILGGENAQYINYPRATIDKYVCKKTVGNIFELIKKFTKLLDFDIFPNDVVFTSRYNTGGEVGIHLDEKFNRNSKYTVLIYLNDNYSGGVTEFYDNKFVKQLDVIPKKGNCVIFDIDLYHSGSIVSNGEKYIMSIDLLEQIVTSSNPVVSI